MASTKLQVLAMLRGKNRICYPACLYASPSSLFFFVTTSIAEKRRAVHLRLVLLKSKPPITSLVRPVWIGSALKMCNGMMLARADTASASLSLIFFFFVFFILGFFFFFLLHEAPASEA